MAFGAHDMQAAQFGHLAALLLHLFFLFDVGDGLLPEIFGNLKSRRVLVLEPRPGHRFGVAAEDDVGTAAGHVRGNGHGADAPGLRDDFRFAGGMFGQGV